MRAESDTATSNLKRHHETCLREKAAREMLKELAKTADVTDWHVRVALVLWFSCSARPFAMISDPGLVFYSRLFWAGVADGLEEMKDRS